MLALGVHYWLSVMLFSTDLCVGWGSGVSLGLFVCSYYRGVAVLFVLMAAIWPILAWSNHSTSCCLVFLLTSVHIWMCRLTSSHVFLFKVITIHAQLSIQNKHLELLYCILSTLFNFENFSRHLQPPLFFYSS